MEFTSTDLYRISRALQVYADAVDNMIAGDSDANKRESGEARKLAAKVVKELHP